MVQQRKRNLITYENSEQLHRMKKFTIKSLRLKMPRRILGLFVLREKLGIVKINR